MAKSLDKKWIFLITGGLLVGLYFITQIFVLITLGFSFLFVIIILDQDFMGYLLPKFITLLIILALVLWNNPTVQKGLGILSAIIIIVLGLYYALKK